MSGSLLQVTSCIRRCATASIHSSVQSSESGTRKSQDAFGVDGGVHRTQGRAAGQLFSRGASGLDLAAHATNKTVDLDTEVDAAIRYGSGSYAGLRAEELFKDSFAPVCTPALAAAAAATCAMSC